MTETRVDPEISKRIAAIRYAMILGVVMLHMPPYQPLDAMDPSGFDLLKGFLSHGLFRATTPTLTVIAGFLMFRSKLDLSPVELFQRKSKTLLLPLVAWNLPLAVILFVMQTTSPTAGEFRVQLSGAEFSTWLDAVVGLSDQPINYPLFFLRDLFVLCLLAPQMGMLLRTMPWLGGGAIVAISLMNLDGPLIMRDTMLINFYMGGMAAVLVKQMRAADAAGPFCLAALLGYSLAIPVFDLADRTVFTIVAPLLIWPAASVLMGTRVAQWLAANASASFFTFLVHGPVLVVAWAGYKMVLGDDFLPELAWLAIPVLVSAACLFIHRWIQRMDFPPLRWGLRKSS
jgi:succinoglycan biosynthesis protein ExoH